MNQWRLGMSNKWINVKDKLPDHMDSVLVFTNKRQQTVCLFLATKKVSEVLLRNGHIPTTDCEKEPYSFASIEVQGNCLNGVTHWMKLPEGPK